MTHKKNEKINITLLFGGKSGEHEVSITSAVSVFRALDKTKYNISLVGICKDGRWVPVNTELFLTKNPRNLNLSDVKETLGFLPFLASKNLIDISGDSHHEQPNVFFPILHGTNGEDGTLQGLLELAEIPYVGAGVLGSSLCMDKDVSKRLLRDAHIPVAPFFAIQKTTYIENPEKVFKKAEQEFDYPYFVKPANTGSSVGVNKVKSKSEARKKFEDALQYDTKILVEKAIDARELEVSVLGYEKPKASVVGEIIPHHEFYTYEAKYLDANGADLKIPAQNLKADLVEKVQSMAVDAFQLLECSGMARVDFFLDRKTDQIFLNELNTIPGFTSISMYPKLWEASGLAYPNLLDKLIEFAIERYNQKKHLKTTYQPPT